MSAKQILDERLAKGEIDKDTYQELLTTLGSASAEPPQDQTTTNIVIEGTRHDLISVTRTEVSPHYSGLWMFLIFSVIGVYNLSNGTYDTYPSVGTGVLILLAILLVIAIFNFANRASLYILSSSGKKTEIFSGSKAKALSYQSNIDHLLSR